MGIRAEVAGSAEEALERSRSRRFHAAVIDLATPRSRLAGPSGAASVEPAHPGLWLLKVLSRDSHAPPTIAVNARLAARQAERVLAEALQLGVFCVINRPVQPPLVLRSIQRLLERKYQNRWPGVADG